MDVTRHSNKLFQRIHEQSSHSPARRTHRYPLKPVLSHPRRPGFTTFFQTHL